MFLYYLPGRRSIPTLDQLKEIGLDCAFERTSTTCGVTGGPDDGSGIVMCQDPTPGVRVGYYPNEQTWTKVPAGPNGPPQAYWIGWYTTKPPTPEVLARENQLPGRMVRLGDGQRWLIPSARQLPHVFRFTPGDGWHGEIAEAHAWILPEADRVRSAYTKAAAAWLPGQPFWVDVEAEDIDLAAKLLGTNYRVGAFELTALNVLQSDTVPAVLLAMLDPDDSAIADMNLEETPSAETEPADDQADVEPAGE